MEQPRPDESDRPEDRRPEDRRPAAPRSRRPVPREAGPGVSVSAAMRARDVSRP